MRSMPREMRSLCCKPAASTQPACKISRDAPEWYHPGRSGALRLGPTVLAYFGEIHPAVLMTLKA